MSMVSDRGRTLFACVFFELFMIFFVVDQLCFINPLNSKHPITFVVIVGLFVSAA